MLAFIASSLGITGMITTAGVSLFPFIIPSCIDLAANLTVWDSSPSHRTLLVIDGVCGDLHADRTGLHRLDLARPARQGRGRRRAQKLLIERMLHVVVTLPGSSALTCPFGILNALWLNLRFQSIPRADD